MNSRTYASGTWIWVPDNEVVWRKAEVIETLTGGELKVKIEDLGVETTLPKDAPTHLYDLTQLTHLHEAAVLNSLNLRFDVDNIYTFTGPILIAVNPFKTIPSIYDNASIQRFLKTAGESSQNQKRVPHVFATGSTAFRGLCDSRTSQTILISGESGAGKTESTKFVMKLLALAGSEDWNNRSEIENQVLQSNPLLEALGNAKTLRNDNSSRFGKFIEMQFTLSPIRGTESLVGRLAGARIHTYLLETVRVCHQLEGERNYHSFYQLCGAAAAAGDTGIYKFPSILDEKATGAIPLEFDLSKFASFDNFRYLTASSCSQLKRINDVEEFENTILAMQTMKIPQDNQISLLNVIGAVLYLGNIRFETPSGNSEGSSVTSSCRPSLKLACHLLGVSEESLENALTFRTITARSETYKIPLKVREAEDTRDALAKALYGTAFLKIVKRTNESIGYRDDVELFCGVLDIFGFECFQFNSFEQLCINFTNERLQQFFNNFIFKCEEEIYTRENIPWSALDFPDNQDCVELMERKNTGIFAMLDEECIVPRGSDTGFCNKMKEKHKDNKRFCVIKTKAEWFVVNHFAGPVNYCVDGFLDKNRDQLSADSQECIKESSSDFVQNLFTEFLNRGKGDEAAKPSTKKRNLTTVSSEFRNQLNYLMETVAQTSPHFIRCLKPNPRNVPDEFERRSVTEQLRYGGVLQAVQVSRAGYPIRLPHRDAYLDYMHLCSRPVLKELQSAGITDKDRGTRMMSHLDEIFKFPKPAHSAHSWAVGETMVFFKHSSYEVLSTERASLRSAKATYIQSRWKGIQQRRLHLHLRHCVMIIQAYMRGAIARRLAQKTREERAARRIQCLARRYLARAAYLQTRRNVIVMQAAWRGYKARLEVLELKKFLAVQRIQACWKAYKARKYYWKLRRATKLAQLRWRQILAKRQLRRLKQEQREAAALLGQKQKLQEENKQLKAKVDETTGHLILVTADRDRLSSRAVELEAELGTLKDTVQSQESRFKAQVEELRSATQMKRLFSGDGRRISTDQNESPRREVESPASRLPSMAEAPVKPQLTKMAAVARSIQTSPQSGAVAEELEKALEDAHTADVEIMKEKDSCISELKSKVEELQAALEEERQKATEADKRYQLLLKNEDFKMPAHIRKSSLLSQSEKQRSGPQTFQDGIKSIDILIVGDSLSGITELVDRLIDQYGQPSEHSRTADSGAVMRYHRITFKEQSLVVAQFLEDSTNDAVKDWAFKSHYVIIAYSLTSETSYRHAHQYVKMTSQHPHRMCFGNRNDLETGAQIDVNVAEVKDYAARSNCTAVEGTSLVDVLEGICTELESFRKRNAGVGDSDASTSLQRRVSCANSGNATGGGAALSSFMSRIHNYFGTTDKAKFGNQIKNYILHPSTNETLSTAQRLQGPTTSPDGFLQPVTELPDNPAAITCVVFGREKAHRDYYLLAAACKDGSVTVYRIYRTEIEKEMWDSGMDSPGNPPSLPDENNISNTLNGKSNISEGGVEVAVQLFGHTRAITHLLFSYKEDQLVTTSIDKSVRFWSLETGDMLKVFADSTSCLVAAFLPFNPSLFIVGNANSILRVVDVRNGRVLQKLRAESEVRAVKFDETGLYCYAGTRNGVLHVLESSDSGNIKFKFKTKLSKCSITCITYVPSSGIDVPPQLFVNSCDSTITIVDCIYGQPTGCLSTLLVRHRVKVAHSLLPLRCCYSAAGGGWLISASEDRNVYIYNVAPNGGYRSVLLRRHQAPVVTVCVNQLNTLLASADSCGRIILWRWVQFRPAEAANTTS